MRIWSEERGASTVATVTAATLALAGFMMAGTLVLWQYGRGVARAASDEGVRVGSVHGVERCGQSIAGTLDDLVGGTFGDGLTFGCWTDGDLIHAEVSGALPGLLPGMPTLTVDERSRRVVDRRG